MNASPTSGMLRALPAEHRHRLMRIAREVSFPQESASSRKEESGRAERFWIIRTGTIDLDMHVPGRRAAVIETLGHDERDGRSWLFTPHARHLDAETTTPDGRTNSTPWPDGRSARTTPRWAMRTG